MPRSFRRVGHLAILGTCAALVAACGGGDDSDASSAAAPAPPAPPALPGAPGSSPLQISGTPSASVTANQSYSFTPNVTPATASLTFTITNPPSWATFNASTGELTGTPTTAHVGAHSGIVIGVTNGETNATLAAFSINVVAAATNGSATLSWTPPTQNTDGSPLSDLRGYKVYWGTSSGDYSGSVQLDNPGLTTYLIEQLAPATWYFTITSLNSQGVESRLSNEASKTIR